MVGTALIGKQQRACTSRCGYGRMNGMVAIHPEAHFAAGIQHDQLRSLFRFILPYDQRRAAIVAQMHVLETVLPKRADRILQFTVHVDVQCDQASQRMEFVDEHTAVRR